MTKSLKKRWKTAGNIVMLLLLLYFMARDTISPTNSTVSTMMGLTRRIAEYTKTHPSMPISLSELPKFKGKKIPIRDGWFRKIEFIEQEDGFFMLRSFGRNGKPGGTDGNADITTSFKVGNGEVEYEITKVGDEIRSETDWKMIMEEIRKGDQEQLPIE